MTLNVIGYFKTLISYRELIVSLAVKDFKVRYKSAALGFLWMLINPIFQMAVLSVVFSIYIKIKVDVPYPLFLLSGLLPWNFMSVSLSAGSHSLVQESNLIKKVYFPREIIPISIVAGHFINFMIALVLFLPFPLAICHSVSWNLLLLPVPIVLHLLFVLILTALASNLDVFYRDTRYIVEALVMIWFYATPIFYTLDLVPVRFQPLIKLNPMTGITGMFRSILLKGQTPTGGDLATTSGIIVILGILVIFLYSRRGPIMADQL
jgi:lipopolysaccharide transport system permease protein